MIDPIEFLTMLDWGNAPQTTYVQELKAVFTSNNQELKMATWEKMNFHAGIVGAIMIANQTDDANIPSC